MTQHHLDMQFPDQLQGFPGLRLNAGKATAFVGAQGAQLLSWQASDGRERLYLSADSGGMRRNDPLDRLAAPIRGGVPVCFPQFSGRGPMIKHGFARGMAWQADQVAAGSVSLSCSDNALTREHWPHAFEASVQVTLEDDAVVVTLAAHNRDSQPWSFSCALHTYLRVDDVRQVRLAGLHGVRYQDATDGNLEKQQVDPMLEISGEVDRVYLAPPPSLALHEPGQPVLTIRQEGFADTVVWNPGPELARKLGDFPDDDWLHMLCVEAAHAAAPLTLQPGERWQGSQKLRVLP